MDGCLVRHGKGLVERGAQPGSPPRLGRRAHGDQDRVRQRAHLLVGHGATAGTRRLRPAPDPTVPHLHRLPTRAQCGTDTREKRIHATRYCKTAPRKAPYLLAKKRKTHRNLLRRFDEILIRSTLMPDTRRLPCHRPDRSALYCGNCRCGLAEAYRTTLYGEAAKDRRKGVAA